VSADLPLTGDELAAIVERARVADDGLFTRSDAVSHLAGRVLAEDVPRLVAEVERLRHALDVIAGEDLDYRGRLRLTDAENAIYVIARDALGRKA
jgi:hypothetical protein